MTGGAHRPPRIFISAGEVSGDIVAARLIDAFRAIDGTSIIDGIGGPRMAQAGANVIASANHIGAIGFSEGLAVVPAGIRVGLAALRHCRKHRPDAAVLISNDVFNILLGRRLRAMGIPTLSLFPPQPWIWRSLAWAIAPSFDRVLASFPDEARCYAGAGLPVDVVGHYLANVLSPVTAKERADARVALGLPHEAPVLLLMPGSRHREIAALFPTMLAAADIVAQARPEVQIVTALSDTATGDEVETRATPGGRRVGLCRDSHLAMRAADVTIVCSGTATLEAALIGLPMVVAYKASRITHLVVRAWIRAGLIHDDTIALPNLIVGHRVVPEFIQDRVTPSNLATGALTLLSEAAARTRIHDAFRQVRAYVERPEALARAARVVLDTTPGAP